LAKTERGERRQRGRERESERERERERERTYVDEAMPPPEAQLSLKTLLVPGINMPLRVLMALAAAAGLGNSTKQ